MNDLPSRRSIFRTAASAVLGLLCRQSPAMAVAQPKQGRALDSRRTVPSLTDWIPQGGRFTFTYSASGNVLSSVDPSGKRTYYWESRGHTQSESAESERNQHRETRKAERTMPKTSALSVSFGPVMPGWGSWQWAGDDICVELSQHFRTQRFDGTVIPKSDVVVFVKFAPPLDVIEAITRRSKVVYSPVDYYGSPAEIDSDGAMLRKCSRILVHCERLRKYFEPYAPVEYMDHHVRFAVPMREESPPGYIHPLGGSPHELAAARGLGQQSSLAVPASCFDQS
jgi:YD repeat-containing protein